MGRTEPQEIRLLVCHVQAIFRQPWTKHPIEALGIGLMLESADEVVRLPTQRHRPLAVCLDGVLEPDVQGMMEVDVGEDR